MSIVRPVIRGAVRPLIRAATGDFFGIPLPAWVTTGNLFTAPQDISDAYWTKGGIDSVVADAIAGPFTGSFGDLVQETTAAGTHQFQRSLSWAAATTYRVRAVVLRNGRNLLFVQSGATPWGTAPAVLFDLVAGTATITAGTPTATIISLGDGWWLCEMVATTTAGGTSSMIYRAANDVGAGSYTGSGPPTGIYIAAVGVHAV